MVGPTSGKHTLTAGAILAIIATMSAPAHEARMVMTHEVEDFDRW